MKQHGPHGVLCHYKQHGPYVVFCHKHSMVIRLNFVVQTAWFSSCICHTNSMVALLCCVVQTPWSSNLFCCTAAWSSTSVYTDIMLSQAQSFACLVEQAACVHVTSKVAHQANQEAGYLSAAILKETNSLACHIDFA